MVAGRERLLGFDEQKINKQSDSRCASADENPQTSSGNAFGARALADGKGQNQGEPADADEKTGDGAPADKIGQQDGGSEAAQEPGVRVQLANVPGLQLCHHLIGTKIIEIRFDIGPTHMFSLTNRRPASNKGAAGNVYAPMVADCDQGEKA